MNNAEVNIGFNYPETREKIEENNDDLKPLITSAAEKYMKENKVTYDPSYGVCFVWFQKREVIDYRDNIYGEPLKLAPGLLRFQPEMVSKKFEIYSYKNDLFINFIGDDNICHNYKFDGKRCIDTNHDNKLIFEVIGTY